MLSALEDRGFRSHLDGDHLTVQAPDELLDDDDREELLTSDIEDRQRWAELLAYRLTRSTHQ